MSRGYTYIWEFFVPAERQAEFERHYADGGSWTQLFRRAPGYVETLLLKDCKDPERYVTVDRWADEAAYRAFRERHAQEYRDLDALCAGFTRGEASLGEFVDAPTIVNP